MTLPSTLETGLIIMPSVSPGQTLSSARAGTVEVWGDTELES